MKKDPADQPQETPPETTSVTPAGDTTIADATAPEPDLTAAPEEPAFDPAIEWPATGGTYVRQADGTLTKEG
ncbi:hypothetical protein [Sphingomonas paucimobilis]|uniref:Uncharacterized protein n=1 Tax=Sphingomonas paucimobilis TaxID=13689 RepID=A0A7T3E6K8_SPHPI|nr:hypothetical protein [Sphingomonas paucimobilis]QPT09715.1 hypothetical protein I6G38_05520 [Sphingomonas paucimobilis]